MGIENCQDGIECTLQPFVHIMRKRVVSLQIIEQLDRCMSALQ
jgi:hypothetical protein